MKVLVYGAGVLGSIYAVRLHESGVDVTLVARGERLKSLREHGVLIAEGDQGVVQSVSVPVIEHATGRWDLVVVLVRSHQVKAVLGDLAGLNSDVLFLLNWAAGPRPLIDVIGRDHVMLGFPNQGGRMDGDIVRYRPASRLTSLVPMSVGESDGRMTPQLERVVAMFRSAGFRVKAEKQMDAWLRTHAAFEVPLGVAVHAAGGPEELAKDRVAVRKMVHNMQESLSTMTNPTVPGAFRLIRIVPKVLLAHVFTGFLRSPAAAPLRTDSPAAFCELVTLGKQLRSPAAESTDTLNR